MFTWGGGALLNEASATRARYIAALQAATRGNIADLLAFATAEPSPVAALATAGSASWKENVARESELVEITVAPPTAFG